MRALISDVNSMEGNSESNSIKCNSKCNSYSNEGNSKSNSYSNEGNSNYVRTGTSQFNSNSGIGLVISKKLQFRSGIDPGSGMIIRPFSAVVVSRTCDLSR